MPQWLYDRLKAETPDITPDFSLRNSARWPAALQIVCDATDYQLVTLRTFYANTQRRNRDRRGDNLVFESVLMAAHYLATLGRMADDRAGHYDYVRSAVVAWYYGIYYAASAMVAAADGSGQESHAATANAWGRQVVGRGVVREPFSYALTTLVKSDYTNEIAVLRNGNTYTLNDAPVSLQTARGGCISYLKGTADRERELLEEEILMDREFKALNRSDFRSSVARAFRDRRLSGKTTNFVHQAIRYRGKANYRDAIFMAYGQQQDEWIGDLIVGLKESLTCFLAMSCCYAERRVERDSWSSFVDDVHAHGRISISDRVFG